MTHISAQAVHPAVQWKKPSMRQRLAYVFLSLSSKLAFAKTKAAQRQFETDWIRLWFLDCFARAKPRRMQGSLLEAEHWAHTTWENNQAFPLFFCPCALAHLCICYNTWKARDFKSKGKVFFPQLLTVFLLFSVSASKMKLTHFWHLGFCAVGGCSVVKSHTQVRALAGLQVQTVKAALKETEVYNRHMTTAVHHNHQAMDMP